MIVQFVVYAILAGVSLGVLYYYLYLMKDMTVDETTGILMIKTNEGASDQEVSIKSHGETFSFDSFVVDPNTGESKGCVLGSNAVSMFKLLSEGTQTKFMAENEESGDVEVTSLGNGKISWTNSSIDLGDGFVLYPDADCTQRYLQGNLGGQRKLSSRDLLDGHLDLREQFLSAIRGFREITMDGRHLWYDRVGGGVVYSTSSPSLFNNNWCRDLANLAYESSTTNTPLPRSWVPAELDGYDITIDIQWKLKPGDGYSYNYYDGFCDFNNPDPNPNPDPVDFLLAPRSTVATDGHCKIDVVLLISDGEKQVDFDPCRAIIPSACPEMPS